MNITIWGGQTDLAQALWRVKHDRGTAGFAAFARKLRVYDIGDQDGIADWMRGEFPGPVLHPREGAGRPGPPRWRVSRHVSHRRRIADQPRLDRRARAQPRTARRALSDEDLDGAQSARRHEGRRHAVVVLLPAARRQRSGRSRRNPAGADSSFAKATAGFAICRPRSERIRASRSAGGGRTFSATSPGAWRGACRKQSNPACFGPHRGDSRVRGSWPAAPGSGSPGT